MKPRLARARAIAKVKRAEHPELLRPSLAGVYAVCEREGILCVSAPLSPGYEGWGAELFGRPGIMFTVHLITERKGHLRQRHHRRDPERRRAQVVGRVRAGGGPMTPDKAVRRIPFVERLSRALELAMGRHMAQFSRGFNACIDREFGVGTGAALGSLVLDREDTRDADMDILARGLARQWRMFSLDERVALAARATDAGRTEEDEKLQLAGQGLLLAACDVERPQVVRLGSRWVVGEDGRKALLRPDDLALVEFLRWYANAAKAAARAALMDGPWPDTQAGAVALDEALPIEDVILDVILLADVTRTALEDMIYAEDQEAAARALSAAEFSPAEHELVREFLDTGDWLEAGHNLGLEPATMRKRKQRILAKLNEQ